VIVCDVTGTENHPVYNSLQVSNLERQYDFLQSITDTALALSYQRLSLPTIKALNYPAIASLHRQAGELRTEPVVVETDGRVEYTGCATTSYVSSSVAPCRARRNCLI